MQERGLREEAWVAKRSALARSVERLEEERVEHRRLDMKQNGVLAK